MKIDRPTPEIAQIESHIEQLNDLIFKLENKENRPCPDCVRPCGCSNSKSCRCECSQNCPYAADQLSSEAGRYPIEPGVLPLVYTMSDMQICQPCWSCEGHNSEQVNPEAQSNIPELRRIPQVWFYSDSVILLRLLDLCLSRFKTKRWLKYDWHITTSFSDIDCVDCAFALKPDLNQVASPNLKLLQEDLITIAEKIPSHLLHASTEHLKQLQKHLEKNKARTSIQINSESRV